MELAMLEEKAPVVRNLRNQEELSRGLIQLTSS